jgi:septum formation protein
MLLDEHGIDHDAQHPGLDDSDLHPGGVSPGQWVAALAYLKSAAGSPSARADGFATVLGADTAIVKNGTLIGTPRDAAEADAMIRNLMDGEHEVVTGVCFLCTASGRRMIYFDRARVRFGRLSDQQVRDYVASGAWQGKAGGYNLRERLEAGWPITFEGDPSTIMGLPMARLRERLDRFCKAAPAAGVGVVA